MYKSDLYWLILRWSSLEVSFMLDKLQILQLILCITLDALQKVIWVGSLINSEDKALGEVLHQVSQHLQSKRGKGGE